MLHPGCVVRHGPPTTLARLTTNGAGVGPRPEDPSPISPRTAESFGKLRTGSASPLGGGEDRRGLYWSASERRGWGGDHEREIPYPRIEVGAGAEPLNREEG